MYLCPMHPEIVKAAAGRCPKCGMLLVKGDPYDSAEYDLSVETTPAAPRAGEPFRMRFTAAHPSTGAPVTQYETVHDKRYHLFVVSQDLEFFAHLHPDQHDDGSLTIGLTLPSAGYYKVISDFLPTGGTPQVIARPLVIAGADRDLRASAAHLIPDRAREKTVDGTRVALRIEPREPIGGREVTLRFVFADASDGAPVRDLEAYLAAWGHTVVLSEDTLDYVHGHPVEIAPPRADRKGGPEITFKALFPRPGPYRMWTQFKREGTVSTVTFTIDVADPYQK
jgi:hypothetical protein